MAKRSVSRSSIETAPENASDIALPLVLYLAALASLGEFASTSYLPAIPTMATQLGIHVTAVQATVTLGLAVFAISGLLVGAFADAFPRKTILLPGLLLYTMGSLLVAVAPNSTLLFTGRTLQAIGSCVGLTIGRAIARDLCTGVALTKLLGGVSLAYSFAPAVAPIIGGFLDEWLSWRAIFCFAALYGAVVIFGAIVLPESKHGTTADVRPGAILRRYFEILRSARFLLPSVLSASLLGALFAFVVSAPPIFISELGLRPAVVGFFPGITVAGVILGSYLATRLASRCRPETMIGAGAAIAFAAAMAIMASPLAVPPLLGILFLFNIGLGIVMPASSAMALSGFGHYAGAASALIGFLQQAGGAVGSALVAILNLPPHAGMPAVMALLSGISLILALLLQLFPADRPR